ncbi:hypothetical protein [Prescottella agglutinans]|uniref:hypothetical protein n=1 Tax=Prescottella agglutinans TaxID=1644129 RepID=UPI003D97BA8A
MTTTDEDVRRAIRDAIDRLIAREPLYSDGKLTIKLLAKEAQIKRWLLTHRHTALQTEFRARIANTDARSPWSHRAMNVTTPTSHRRTHLRRHCTAGNRPPRAIC